MVWIHKHNYMTAETTNRQLKGWDYKAVSTIENGKKIIYGIANGKEGILIQKLKQIHENTEWSNTKELP